MKIVLILALLLAGCMAQVVRLGPDECAVAFGRHEVITAGKGC